MNARCPLSSKVLEASTDDVTSWLPTTAESLKSRLATFNFTDVLCGITFMVFITYTIEDGNGIGFVWNLENPIPLPLSVKIEGLSICL